MRADDDPDSLRFELDVPFRPHWRNVELLRTSVLNCLATIFESYDFCEQLGMTAAELLENSIGHGTWSSDGREPLRLSVCGNAAEVRVEVTNPIRGGGEDLARLLAIIRAIDEADSPRSAYAARLLELSSDPTAQGSRLGLLRTAFETGAKLSVDVAEDRSSVKVRATIRAADRAQAA
jgi:hypothetical protein